MDGVLGVLEEVILVYGSGKVKWTEFVHNVIDGRGKVGVRVEQHLLLCHNDLCGIVDLAGSEGVHFDGVSLTICARDSREQLVNCV